MWGRGHHFGADCGGGVCDQKLFFLVVLDRGCLPPFGVACFCSPGAPPKEPQWSDIPSNVKHLTQVRKNHRQIVQKSVFPVLMLFHTA